MIAEPKSPPAGPALTWAASQLGVPPESLPEAGTAAFLRRLAEEDFVPPARLREAWELAALGSSAGGPAMRWLDGVAEEELSERVEEFAGQFFNLPVKQRSAHWERLYADARRWPRLETRLRRLKPGLAVEFAPRPTLSLREAKLIHWVRELFALPPELRALRRRKMLRDEVDSDIRLWQTAAQRLRRRDRALAALAPDLLVPLATWSRRVKAAARNRPKRRVGDVKWWRPLVRSGQNMFRSVRWLPFALVFGCVLVKHLLEYSPPQPPRYSPPIYSPPSAPSEPIDPKTMKLIQELLSKSRVESAPNDPPRPIDPKIRELLEGLGDKDQPPASLTPETPLERPSTAPLVPDVPGNPPGASPGGDEKKPLLPQTDPLSQPAPAAPAGKGR